MPKEIDTLKKDLMILNLEPLERAMPGKLALQRIRKSSRHLVIIVALSLMSVGLALIGLITLLGML